MKRLIQFALLATALCACEGSLSPFCVATAGSDVMTKVKYHCPLTAEEQRTFNGIIEARQREANKAQQAAWESRNPNLCPPRLTQPYDYKLAALDSQFMSMSQFSVVTDGYGRAVQRVYVPTELGDTILANMRRTMQEREAMCRSNGFHPSGYMPAIFGTSAYGIP